MLTKNNWAFEKDTRGDLSDMIFLEWKYFSFDSEDVDGFICYVMGNPRNLMRTGRGMICYAFYHNGEYRKGCLEIPFKKISLDKDEWHFHHSSVKSHTDDRWILNGTVDDIEWNLTFKNISSGGSFSYQGDRTILGQRWVNWDVISNISKIEGDLTIEGEEIEIDCLGYIDTNYGHWQTYRNLWQWVQKSIPEHGGIAFSFFNIQNKKSRVGRKNVLFLNIGDERYVLDEITFEIEGKDDDGIPEKYTVNAFSDESQVKFDLVYSIEEYDIIKVRLFRVIPLVNLYLLRGTAEFDIISQDTGKNIHIERRASGEYPKKPVI